MFEDEARFGRINKPKRCLCLKGIHPIEPCLHIREYRYAFGAVETKTGDAHFLILPRCDTQCMNYFLKDLSDQYPNTIILLGLDDALWHRAKSLEKMIDRLCDTISSFSADSIKSITGRDWILSMF